MVTLRILVVASLLSLALALDCTSLTDCGDCMDNESCHYCQSPGTKGGCKAKSATCDGSQLPATTCDCSTRKGDCLDCNDHAECKFCVTDGKMEEGSCAFATACTAPSVLVPKTSCPIPLTCEQCVATNKKFCLMNAKCIAKSDTSCSPTIEDKARCSGASAAFRVGIAALFAVVVLFK